MAIIRKGDKKAEENLKVRAQKQNRNRLLASEEEKRKAGLEFAGTKSVKRNKDGKTTASKLSTKKSVRVTKSESPISGSAVTEAKIFAKNRGNVVKRDAELKKFKGK